jgi:two-component system KDP operon response regulator KdpE
MSTRAERSGAAALVLVIDDEPQLRRFLDITLRAQGHRTVLAASGTDGLAIFAANPADLVILDLGLPDLDGIEVLRELRTWSKVPVIALTVSADEEQKVAVLDAGANDYVTKPFGIQELMARIRVLLRQRPAQDLSVFDDGRLFVDPVHREVRRSGALVLLSRKEYALLLLLLEHQGRVLTQSHLLRSLWGAQHERDTHYLRILVGKLRAKLGDDAAQPTWIATEPGVGLRFIGKTNRADPKGASG